MNNNVQIRVQGQLNRQLSAVETLNMNITLMSDEELSQLESAVKVELKIVKKRVDLVKILSGKQIGKKAFEDVQNHQEFVETTDVEGLEFSPHTKKALDVNGNIVNRIVYSEDGVSRVRQLPRGIVDDETFDGVSKKMKKYSSREDNGKQQMNALKNVLFAITKKRADDMVKVLETKRTKNVKLGDLGRALLKGNEVQLVGRELLKGNEIQEVKPLLAV